jgi:glycosyltransferase involved in cell wall biosynthesis
VDAPTISVIIPVRNGGRMFSRCVAALAGSTLKPYEFFVVDDGSTDDTRENARQAGATVLQTDAPGRGPAAARNVAAAAATGDVLYFFDSDVEIQPTTLARIQHSFGSDPTLTALFGSYDDTPGHPGFLSQYKNLFHHYVHQLGSTEASTFWSGCGAVRREAFLANGGFASRYELPSIEDIELGYALKRSGHRIVLDKALQVKHLKQWTLASLIHSDIIARGIPWTRLILREGAFLNDLNLQTHNRISVVVVYAALLCLLLGFWNPLVWGGLVVSALALLFLNRHLYAFMAQKRGWAFGVAAVAPHWLYYAYNGVSFGLGSLLHIIERDPQPGQPETSGRNKRIFALIMAAVLSVAVLMRSNNLNRPILSPAEQQQVQAAAAPAATIIGRLLEPGAMPLSLAFTHVALRFGAQPFWLRVASAMASLVTVALIYRFVGRILGRVGGVLAALVLAVGAFDIYLGQQVSGYSLFGLLSLLSFHSLLRALKNNRYDAWIGYAINLTLCLFAHTFGIFVLFSQIAIAAVYLWLPPTLKDKSARLAGFGLALASAGLLLGVGLAVAAVLQTGGSPAEISISSLAASWADTPGDQVWVAISLLLTAAGAVLVFSRDRRFGAALLVWAVLPTGLMLAYGAPRGWPVLMPDMVPLHIAAGVFMSVALLSIFNLLVTRNPRLGWAAWIMHLVSLLLSALASYL